MDRKTARKELETHLVKDSRGWSRFSLNERLRDLRENVLGETQADVARWVNKKARELLRDHGKEVPDDFELYSLQSIRRYEGSAEGGEPPDLYIHLFERAFGLRGGTVRQEVERERDRDHFLAAKRIEEQKIADRARARERLRSAIRLPDDTPLPQEAIPHLEALAENVQSRFPERELGIALAPISWIGAVLRLAEYPDSPEKAKDLRDRISHVFRRLSDLTDEDITQAIVALSQAARILTQSPSREMPREEDE